ncbi:MAG: glycosyltransferase [Bacteroidetes bacterium]|nr:glycosyltransferase [Bacteroidota bacterium]
MLAALFDQLPAPPPGKTGWPWTYTPEADAATQLPPSPESLPAVTLITPTFNQADYIEETLRSVILQGYPKLEYLVYDAQSTDGTPAILERYSPWITFWVSEPDKGQSDAINKGLARATGEVINWLNSDDYYTPGTLLAVGEAFRRTQALAVGGYGRLFGDGPDRYGQGTDIYPQLAKTIGWARIDQPETFFHREAVETMGPLEPTLRYCMDRDWWLRFLLHFGQERVHKLDRCLVNFRLHPQSKTQSQQKGFFEERDTIFCQIAVRYDLRDVAAQIREWAWVVERPGYKFSCSTRPDAATLHTAFQYFGYQLAQEAYAAGDRRRFARIAGQLDTQVLAPEDAAHLKRLRWRNRWLPAPLLRLLRKLR